jgi:hypothetical protein
MMVMMIAMTPSLNASSRILALQFSSFAGRLPKFQPTVMQ